MCIVNCEYASPAEEREHAPQIYLKRYLPLISLFFYLVYNTVFVKNTKYIAQFIYSFHPAQLKGGNKLKEHKSIIIIYIIIIIIKTALS